MCGCVNVNIVISILTISMLICWLGNDLDDMGFFCILIYIASRPSVNNIEDDLKNQKYTNTTSCALCVYNFECLFFHCICCCMTRLFRYNVNKSVKTNIHNLWLVILSYLTKKNNFKTKSFFFIFKRSSMVFRYGNLSGKVCESFQK